MGVCDLECDNFFCVPKILKVWIYANYPIFKAIEEWRKHIIHHWFWELILNSIWILSSWDVYVDQR